MIGLQKKRKKLALAPVSIESIMRVIMPYVLIFYNGGKAFLKNAFTSLKKNPYSILST
jgi:hypothetical protein